MNTEIGRVEGHRKFCNKLWNATKFCLFRMDLVNLEGVRQKSNFVPNISGLVSEGRSGGWTESEKQGLPADVL
jgi:valyl-tRNA synthetase